MDSVERDRTQEQNKKLHAMFRDIARHVEWAGRKWSEQDRKKILLGAKFGQSFVPSPFGHLVVMVNSKRSSHLTVDEMTEFIGEIEAFGIEQGVDWSEDE